MKSKTSIPIILCGMLVTSACRHEPHTLPPTETPPDDPGEAVIDEELAPPEDPEEMRTPPEGEAVEEYREEQAEEFE